MILNDGGELLECISADKKHEWKVIREPEGNRSGWHKRECIICGAVEEWDDSD